MHTQSARHKGESFDCNGTIVSSEGRKLMGPTRCKFSCTNSNAVLGVLLVSFFCFGPRVTSATNKAAMLHLMQPTSH